MVCTHCLRQPNILKKKHCFPYEQCLRSMSKSYLLNCKLDGTKILTDEMAPDLTLPDIPNIPAEDITTLEVLGINLFRSSVALLLSTYYLL